jgi:cation transport regulator ChaC
VTVGADDRVWGVCYEIDPAYAVEVRAYLDHREKDGYSVAAADIWHDDEVVIPQVRLVRLRSGWRERL